MSRRLRELHGLLGRNLALLLICVLASGSLLTVSEDIQKLLNPALQVTPSDSYAAVDQWLKSVADISPHSYVDRINLPNDGSSAAEVIVRRADGSRWRAYVDPYSGHITGTGEWLNLHRFLRDLHRMLFLPESIGLLVVTPLAVLLFFQGLSALRFQRNVRAALLEPPRFSTTRLRRSSLHRFGGFWSIIFSFILAVTGCWYLIERIADSFDASVFQVPKKVTPLIGVIPTPSIDALLTAAQDKWDDFKPRIIVFPRRADEPLVIYGQTSSVFVRDTANYVAFDTADGSISDSHRVTNASALARWAHTADIIHFGEVAGLGSRLFWLASGLALTIVTYLGLRLSFDRGHINPRRWFYVSATFAAFLCTAGYIQLASYSQTYGEEFRSLGVRTLGTLRFELGISLAEEIAVIPLCNRCFFQTQRLKLRNGIHADAASVTIGNNPFYTLRARFPEPLKDDLVLEFEDNSKNIDRAVWSGIAGA